MNSINKTLYIPLYGKAYVSRKGMILHDPKAQEIWAAEEFPLKGKSKWLAYYMIPDFQSREEAAKLFDRLRELSLREDRYVAGIYLDQTFIGILNETEVSGSSGWIITSPSMKS